MRRFKVKNNKGYSLAEMIIVIAIIAIMCGAAVGIVGLMNNAKAREASVNFDSEISGLVAQAKSQTVKFDNGSGTVEVHKDWNFAIAIYKNKDNKFYILHGYYKPSSNTFKVFDADNGKDDKGKSISARVNITYNVGAKNDGTLSGIDIAGDTYDNVWVVSYDKAGRCICGVGSYEFKDSKTNSMMEAVTINANGSHISK